MADETRFVIEVDEEDRPGRGRWWGPDGSGYTNLFACAGLYEGERVRQLVPVSRAHLHRGRPLAEALDDVLRDREWMAYHGFGFERPAKDGTVGKLFVDLDIPGQLRRAAVAEHSSSRRVIGALYEAVQYVLDRAQEDPDLGYQVGPGTEAFRMLVAAEAAHLGVDADELAVERGRDLQPAHRKRRAERLELRDQVEWLSQFGPQCAIE